MLINAIGDSDFITIARVLDFTLGRDSKDQ